MAVPCGGIKEKLPVACACVAENALLHDGTTQRDVLRERPARTGGLIALQKPTDPIVVGVRSLNAFQYRPIPIQQALRGHSWNETQLAVDVVSVSVADKASFKR
jgi:hypothetical protein